MSNTLMSNYDRLPVTFLKGKGAELWDADGKRYLDALSGIAVTGLGHAHPAITSVICEQANTLLHTSNLYHIAHQQALADKLADISGMETAFFCNSGAEANEAALKIARLYGHEQGIEKPHIIVMEGAFHGRTLATLTATGNPKVQKGFEPLVEGFIRVPYNNMNAIKEIGNNTSIVAILVEPIQGEGGIVIPDADYIQKLRAFCDEHNWLLMLDEVQTGMGRTGKWFAYQGLGILPDVLTIAKGLGNGIPIGACLARGKVARIFKAGNHGSTFGGNPLACRVALSVIETIEKDSLLQRVNELSQRIYAGFVKNIAHENGVKNIRAQGLLMAIELNTPCTQLIKDALNAGLLINVTAERAIRLLPPFILSDAQADEIVHTISQLVKNFLQGSVA